MQNGYSRGRSRPRLGLWILASFFILGGARLALAEPILDVDQALLAELRTAAATPPVASRDIAMVDIAMYDAVNAASGLQDKPYSYTGSAVPGASPDAVAYAAGFNMLTDLFPTKATAIQSQQSAEIGALGLTTAVQTASVSLGSSVAGNLFIQRVNDGSATAQTPYTPGNQPGNYQFTKAGQTTVVEPGWGSVTPFAITSVASVAPPPLWGAGTPYPTEAAYIASPKFQSDIQTVETTGCKGCGQTPDQLALTAFWSDTNGNAVFGSTATPAGQWLDITDTVAAQQGLGLLQTARLTAMVGASLADAGIAGWDVKNSSNFWRPDTAIHAAGDTSWAPLWPDPLFQSYISGHSVFSMSAAATLAAFFGTDNISFCSTADPNSHDANNLPLSTTGAPYTVTYIDTNGNPYTVTVDSASERCYTSFTDAAEEAGYSRILGGIHFPSDNVEGLATGAAIAAEVVANDFTVAEPNTMLLLVGGVAALATMQATRRRVQRAD